MSADVDVDPWVPRIADESSQLPDMTDEEREALREQQKARKRENLRDDELDKRRAREEASRLYAAETAPKAQRLTSREFLARPRPTRLVPHLLYLDSLARMWGKDGSGKSFVVLDLACRVCLGMSWAGQPISPGPVFYVMAEGGAINRARLTAWLEHHDIDAERFHDSGNFYAYEDAIPLVEGGIDGLLEDIAEVQPVLIILDTKNAMMAGEENSATDSAALRRALDALRKASGACVLLVDHAGHDAARARGSTAVRAAMDTELAVTIDGENRPKIVKVVVDRDKAADTGFTRTFELLKRSDTDGDAVLVRPQAVQDSLDSLVDLDALDDTTFDPTESDWQTAEGLTIPDAVADYDGRGQAALGDLARYMAHEASPDWGDPSGVGKTRAEAQRELKERLQVPPTTLHRAWSALRSLELIEPAGKSKEATARHRWVPRQTTAEEAPEPPSDDPPS